MPRIEERWQKEIKKIDRFWEFRWNPKTCRFMVVDNLDERGAGSTGYKIVTVLRNHDGSFRPIDMRAIRTLRKARYEMDNDANYADTCMIEELAQEEAYQKKMFDDLYDMTWDAV